jgi:hypothetical protein
MTSDLNVTERRADKSLAAWGQPAYGKSLCKMKYETGGGWEGSWEGSRVAVALSQGQEMITVLKVPGHRHSFF